MTREVLKSEHQAATEKMAEVQEFRHRRSEELVSFALKAAAQRPQMATTALERAMDYLAVLRTERARALVAEAARIQGKLGQADRESMQPSINRTRSSMASFNDEARLASGTEVANVIREREPYFVGEAEIVQEQNASCSLFSFFLRGASS